MEELLDIENYDDKLKDIKEKVSKTEKSKPKDESLSKADKKLYEMAGFVNWDKDGNPHYFLSSEAFKSLDNHLREMRRTYREKGWDYDLPVLDPEEFGNLDDIDSSHLDISVKDYPISKEVLCKAAIKAYDFIRGF